MAGLFSEKKIQTKPIFFFSQMRPAKVSNVTKLSSRHAVHIFRNSSWTILVSIPLSFSGKVSTSVSGKFGKWSCGWKKSLKGIILLLLLVFWRKLQSKLASILKIYAQFFSSKYCWLRKFLYNYKSSLNMQKNLVKSSFF